jgi:hypothetical protein
MTQIVADLFTTRAIIPPAVPYNGPAMKLSVAGHPLHTRSLTLSAIQREDGKQDLAAAVVDLRKCGFVPVAGFLQASGIVHHMTLSGRLDPETRILEHFEGAQPTRAFDPSALTQGECCSDPLPRLAALAGEKVDARFVSKLRVAFGGPLGCSHLLTLAQLLASGVSHSLDWDERQPETSRARRPGERVFERAVEIDGYELPDGRLQVSVQLTDLHLVAAPEIAVPMAQFGAQSEIRISAVVDIANGMALGSLEGFSRARDYAGLESARFIDRSSELQYLEGQNIMSGVSKRMLENFGSEPADRPFLDALLMMAPGYLQCLASLSESWPENAKRKPSLLGVMGRADSCYMWRNGGPVRRAESEQEVQDRS